MNYKILDLKNIIEYIKSISKVTEYFGDDPLHVSEIGDGNLNFVFIIKSEQNPKKALILKQAVPYLRCVGEEYPLSRERMTFEIRALLKQSEFTPKFVPFIYDASEEMSVVVMQFLDEHIIMRKGMIASTVYPDFAEHISTFLAQNLFKTSSLFLDSTCKRQLVESFNKNVELCKLTEDFVFSFAFMEHESNDENAKDNETAKKLFEDMDFKTNVLKLKYKFMTQSDALLHGDLHTGSIMLNQKETFVIDPEFAFVGPFGFDIGALIGNLVMSYVSHLHVSKDEKYQEWILALIEDILTKFEEKFLTQWNEVEESALHVKGFMCKDELISFKKEFMKSILRDTIGYAGCKMARRMFGIAGVEDIRAIEDTKAKGKAEAQVLEIAKRFVKKYENIETIQDIKKMII
jgi:5-methylthioribose kinase